MTQGIPIRYGNPTTLLIGNSSYILLHLLEPPRYRGFTSSHCCVFIITSPPQIYWWNPVNHSLIGISCHGECTEDTLQNRGPSSLRHRTDTCIVCLHKTSRPRQSRVHTIIKPYEGGSENSAKLQVKYPLDRQQIQKALARRRNSRR